MTCEAKPNKIAQTVAQLAAGISRLTSKRSFYAGVAAGAAGTGGAMFLANRFRRSRERIGSQLSLRPTNGVNYGNTGIAAPPPVGRNRIGPGSIPTVGAQPAGGTRSNNLQKIPMVGIQPAGGTRIGPRQLSMAGIQPAGKNLPRLVPVLGAPLPDTKLQAAEIKVQANGQVFIPAISYRVLTPDGRDTGLAITPEIVEKDATDPLVEKENSWCVTHTRTGQLISGPYDTINKAQKLATQLAPLSWGAASMTAGEIGRAQQIITDYQRSLEGGKE